jgi:hypothetical protein
MNLDELRNDIARKQKKGLPFICASVTIWFLILMVTFIKAACLATKPICVLLFLPVNAFGMGNW